MQPHYSEANGIRRKGRIEVWAGPKIWGPWTEIWSQFGVVGPNAANHQSVVDVSFDVSRNGEGASSFDVEIRGGDRFISTVGSGSAIVTVTGNVATSIAIRCRSHSLGLNVEVWTR